MSPSKFHPLSKRALGNFWGDVMLFGFGDTGQMRPGSCCGFCLWQRGTDTGGQPMDITGPAGEMEVG